jgi:hypothetical protein
LGRSQLRKWREKMINNAVLNSQKLRADLPLVKIAPKQLSKLGFGSEDNEKDNVNISSSETQKEAPARKFSINNAFGNYVDGLISPLTQLIDSVKTPGGAIKTAASMLFMKHMLKNVPSLKRPLIVVTAALGVFNLGLGVKNIVKNKDDAEAQEESFKELGKGTTLIGVSGIFAPKALANETGVVKIAALPMIKGKPLPLIGSAEIEIAKNTQPTIVQSVRAFIQCVKDSPKAVSDGFIAIKNKPIILINFLAPSNLKQTVNEFTQSVLANDMSQQDPNMPDMSNAGSSDNGSNSPIKKNVPSWLDPLIQLVSGEAREVRDLKKTENQPN